MALGLLVLVGLVTVPVGALALTAPCCCARPPRTPDIVSPGRRVCRMLSRPPPGAPMLRAEENAPTLLVSPAGTELEVTYATSSRCVEAWLECHAHAGALPAQTTAGPVNLRRLPEPMAVADLPRQGQTEG